MKIVFITHLNYKPDGVADFVNNLCQSLSTIINDVSCVNQKKNAVRIIRDADHVVFSYPYLSRRNNWLEDFYFLLIAVFFTKPVLYLHEWQKLKISRKVFLLPFIFFSNRIFVPSTEIAIELKYLKLIKKVSVILIAPNLVFDSNKFVGNQDSKKIRIGLFGLCYHGKNFEEIIDFATAIQLQGTEVEVIWVGSFIDEDYAKRIMKCIDDFNSLLNAQFIHLGHLSVTETEVTAFVTCDFFLALHDEGFDERHGSTLSLLSTGRPVIAMKKRQSDFNYSSKIKDYTNLVLIDRERIEDQLLPMLMKLKSYEVQGVRVRTWLDVASEFNRELKK